MTITVVIWLFDIFCITSFCCSSVILVALYVFVLIIEGKLSAACCFNESACVQECVCVCVFACVCCEQVTNEVLCT